MLFTVSIQDIQNMDKENGSSLLGNPPMRLTRARTKSLGQSGRLQGMYPTAKSDGNRPLRSNFKREATDENKPSNNAADRLHKKRAVLKDVSNVVCETYLTCVNATKIQRQLRKCGKKAPSKRNAKVGPALLEEKPQVQEEKKESANEKTEEDMILRESSKAQISTHSDKIINTSETFLPDNMPVKHNGSNHVHLQNLSKTAENRPSEKDDCLDRLGIIDIDSQNKDPLMCGIYAPSIYQSMNTMELDRRPSIDYMENLQVDITEGMRGILIDWLVEVSEEYKLVPDTLYLTVNLIDRFLSGNHVEKQKLQLLGVTCMLIASKYEEICAPRVEEFCFITDNSYTKEEVVKTESKVLNFLGFQLSVPTSKKFLRRFIQVAQISFKVPSVELEFLANYLGELTLLKYSFLKFLPSLIAASAVFLARWVLNQSDHPWNFTMEHYTGYKTMELKTTVLALQELLLNTNGCSLNAIREKYKQEKFKRVENLSASKSVQSLFN